MTAGAPTVNTRSGDHDDDDGDDGGDDDDDGIRCDSHPR
jgi:hypothetical protein